MAGNRTTKEQGRTNHWETECTNADCGHRKGSHYLIYGTPSFEGIKAIGSCDVDGCECKGFSDGWNWKDGYRRDA